MPERTVQENAYAKPDVTASRVGPQPVTNSVLKGEMRPLRNPAALQEVEELFDDEN
jgi:hypothetical protein